MWRLIAWTRREATRAEEFGAIDGGTVEVKEGEEVEASASKEPLRIVSRLKQCEMKKSFLRSRCSSFFKHENREKAHRESFFFFLFLSEKRKSMPFPLLDSFVVVFLVD